MTNENYVLSALNELPEQWIGKEMNLHVIAKKKDAIWIINRILQDVERLAKLCQQGILFSSAE
jgi:hypothetical protein